ncbi:substrate-binding periplasmic protein [Aestuariispira insulae]|uniref:Amino acid ABC transporter substrate-binding protein (PAAT family) n=1 Tax=Aestuariispira insulae TaxID=1461337 RepID=A0A3D9HQ41_9PROT|nr:ABC transporter substrate-binding protein [Aestuariispira insulae]RED51515.1 amino acid ABC transporter substrate-binding protein (PAAT family) [Aestuariispira insulae]
MCIYRTGVIPDRLLAKTLACAVAFFLFPLSQALAEDRRLEVLAEEFPPFNYVEDGELKGFAVDLVREMFHRTDFHAKGGRFRVLPWKRAYLLAQTRPDILLLTTTRTEEREEMFQWVGPIYPREQWLYRRADDQTVKVRSLEDLEGYNMVVVAQSANHQLLLDGGYGERNHIFETSSIESKIKMLLHARAQIAPFLPLEVAHALSRQNLPPGSFERLVKLSGRYHYFLAISRQTMGEKAIRLQSALDEMRRDGTYNRILARNMGGS